LHFAVPADAEAQDAGAPATEAGKGDLDGNRHVCCYLVRVGDTLAGVAKFLGMPIRDLQICNRIFHAGPLPVGSLLFYSRNGLAHKVKDGQSLDDISAAYGVPVGAIGEANDLLGDREVTSGMWLVVPLEGSSFLDTIDALSGHTPSEYVWPALGTVRYPYAAGRGYSSAIGISGDAAVRASAFGYVYMVGTAEDGTIAVGLEHALGLISLYAHLASCSVEEGQCVEQGQIIGQPAGSSSGIPEFAFVFQSPATGEPIDPRSVLPRLE
jgi:hypothetical protein